MKDLEFNNDNDKNSSTVVFDIDAPVVKEKKLEEILNTISATVTDSDLIDEKNNFLADEKIIEVKENVEMDANDAHVFNEKLVEEKLNTISAAVNDSDVIGDKNNFVADDKIIEVKETV